MKTDVITVSRSNGRISAALKEADKVAAFQGLTGKNALHVRLLTEEMMGMMRSITGETEGEFWIENEGKEYCFHLRVLTRMNSEKRDMLLSASSTGRNDAARGLMGRLRDFFDRGMDEDVASVSSPILLSGVNDEATTNAALDWEWSMTQYQEALAAGIARQDKDAREAWDELEKSVVARVADDVRVSIRGRTVEMTIMKKLD